MVGGAEELTFLWWLQFGNQNMILGCQCYLPPVAELTKTAIETDDLTGQIIRNWRLFRSLLKAKNSFQRIIIV